MVAERSIARWRYNPDLDTNQQRLRSPKQAQPVAACRTGQSAVERLAGCKAKPVAPQAASPNVTVTLWRPA